MCFRLKKKKIKYSTNKELLLPGKKRHNKKQKTDLTSEQMYFVKQP